MNVVNSPGDGVHFPPPRGMNLNILHNYLPVATSLNIAFVLRAPQVSRKCCSLNSGFYLNARMCVYCLQAS